MQQTLQLHWLFQSNYMSQFDLYALNKGEIMNTNKQQDTV